MSAPCAFFAVICQLNRWSVAFSSAFGTMNGEVITLDKELFGAFIAENRKRQGLTQQQLAGRLHITDKAVSKWERGLSYPDVTLLQPLAAALGLRVDDLLTCRAAEKEEPLEPDITPTPEPAAPESTAPEAASPAVQAVLDISQESLWQRKRQLIQRIAAGVILLAVLVFAALGVFLIYTQRIGETYNIIERSHSPADQTISIEAYPASLFNDDKTLIRMWWGRYYLADSGSDRTYVSFPLDKNEEFGFFNWARNGSYVLVSIYDHTTSQYRDDLWDVREFKKTHLAAAHTDMGARVRELLPQSGLLPEGCDADEVRVDIVGFTHDDCHLHVDLRDVPMDGEEPSHLRIAYDIAADALVEFET